MTPSWSPLRSMLVLLPPSNPSLHPAWSPELQQHRSPRDNAGMGEKGPTQTGLPGRYGLTWNPPGCIEAGTMNLFKAHRSPRSPCPEGNGCLVTAGFSESSLCPWLLSDTPGASPASCCTFHLGPPASEGTLVQRSLPVGRRVMVRVLVPRGGAG